MKHLFPIVQEYGLLIVTVLATAGLLIGICMFITQRSVHEMSVLSRGAIVFGSYWIGKKVWIDILAMTSSVHGGSSNEHP